MSKVSKASVDYSPAGPEGDRCDKCVHWQPPDACEVVEGRIRAGDWCMLWVSPKGLGGARARRPEDEGRRA